MVTFEDFFKELCSNYVWFQPASMNHKPETFRDVANKVYMQYVASEVFPPIQEARKHVFNKLSLIPPDAVKAKPWHVQALEKEEKEKDKEWKPADPAHVDKCVKEFFDMLKDAPMMNYRPSSREKVYYNGKPAEKLPPHPITSPEEAYEKDRHFEYIKANYHPLTREKLPGWMSEREFNRLYDEGLI